MLSRCTSTSVKIFCNARVNVSSIAMFCRNALSVFSRAKKDVLYDFLKREDIHWRKFNLHTAREVYRQHGLVHSPVKAFVLDDSIKTSGQDH